MIELTISWKCGDDSPMGRNNIVFSRRHSGKKIPNKIKIQVLTASKSSCAFSHQGIWISMSNPHYILSFIPTKKTQTSTLLNQSIESFEYYNKIVKFSLVENTCFNALMVVIQCRLQLLCVRDLRKSRFSIIFYILYHVYCVISGFAFSSVLWDNALKKCFS